MNSSKIKQHYIDLQRNRGKGIWKNFIGKTDSFQNFLIKQIVIVYIP